MAGSTRGATTIQSLVPADLRCNFSKSPLGVDAKNPELSWRLESNSRNQRQTAFQVIVASSPALLTHSIGDLWDSGRVMTNATTGILYEGKILASSQPVFWKVRVWDKDDHASAWSKPARWEMGLMSVADWQAQWLNDGKDNPKKDEDFYKDDPAPLFRKQFIIAKKVARARLYISGLGYYEASLNGQRIGDQMLDPGWTQYAERILYSTFDVTDQLRRGDNCLGVMLGNGWYNPLPLRMWGHLNLREKLTVGRPCFIARLQMDFTDGTTQAIVSDPTWKVVEGPIRFNSLYLGEIYDARREATGWDHPGFEDNKWRQAAVATEPSGTLQAQLQPPIRVTKRLKPVKLTEPLPGVFIFDLGQNFGGWVNLKV